MKIPSSSINQKEIINNIRTRLLTYTLRELNPISRLDNKTKINSQSSREIEKKYDMYIIVEKDIISSPSHNVKYGVQLHQNTFIGKTEEQSPISKISYSIKKKKVLFSQKKINRDKATQSTFHQSNCNSSSNTCSTFTQDTSQSIIENNSIQILRTYASTLKMSKKFVDSLNKNYVLFIFTFQIIQKDFSILSSKECNSILR